MVEDQRNPFAVLYSAAMRPKTIILVKHKNGDVVRQ
jgi:hypothetical protein